MYVCIYIYSPRRSSTRGAAPRPGGRPPGLAADATHLCHAAPDRQADRAQPGRESSPACRLVVLAMLTL
eukprot:11130892-Heterocapsa_arctica.AAC.1